MSANNSCSNQNVSNQINKKNIIDKVSLIKLFYKKNFNINPKIAY